MQIYGRDTLSTEEIWQLYQFIIQTPELWRPETFKEAAKKGGLSRVAAREGYFSFTGKKNIKGQAHIVNNFVEEIRFFIVNEPRNLTEELYKKDRHKVKKLAAEYSTKFKQQLGESRVSSNNDIFEYNDHRLRVLPNNQIGVVISKLSILKQLPNDWWAEK